MTRRQLLLGLALLVAAGLAFLPPPQEPDVEIVAPARPKAAARPAPAQAQAAAPTSLKPAFAAEAGADLFAAQSFRPPPPPPPKVVPAPPPPPMAPPIPYGYVGTWTENGQETVFLSQGDRVLHVRRGVSLAGGWRLDDVQPGALQFTYEPLNQQKTLRISP